MNFKTYNCTTCINSCLFICLQNESCSTCCSGTEQLLKSDRYNQNQVCCIEKIISELRCNHENSVQLVWGSPGTGKTFLTCTLMNILMNSGSRVLVCVPTERMIFKLLSKVKSEFPEFEFSNLIVLNDLNGIFSATSLPNRCHELY